MIPPKFPTWDHQHLKESHMKSIPRRKLTPTYISVLSALALLVFGAIAQAGTLDTSFGTGGGTGTSIGFYDFARRVFILPDGKILIAGVTAYVGFHAYAPSPMLARFNGNGSLDTTFGQGGVVNGQLGNTMAVNDVLLQPDGKIVFVGGLNPGWNSPPLDFGVARFNSDGTKDTTFGDNGLVRTAIGGSYDIASGVVYLPDGKLLVVGYTHGTSTSPGAIDFVRYNSNGTLDETFGEGGIVYHLIGSANSIPTVDGMVKLSDGKLLINGQGFFARFNPDGSFDNGFGNNGFVYHPYAGGRMTLQPDGKVLTAGSGTACCSYTVFAISRFNTTDGSADAGFGTNGTVLTPFRKNTIGYANAVAYDVVVKSNGEIIAIGVARGINGTVSSTETSAVAAAHYTSNGVLIAKTAIAFPPYQSTGSTLAIQPDGKIVLVGYVSHSDSDLAIARLTAITNDIRPFRRLYDFDGSLSTDLMIYRPGTGGSSSVWYNRNTDTATPFGTEGDIITPADYNDDGYTDIAVFRPSNGTWYITTNIYYLATQFYAVQWGADGDIPAAADYDGDGKADLAVFRPSNGTWYIQESQTGLPRYVTWGLLGDKPVVGDYDGDGKADIAVFRPSAGYWYVQKSSNGELLVAQLGTDGDIPVQADYNGDNKTDIAVFRPSTGIWYTSTNPATNYGAIPFGKNGDIPVVGDYTGDGWADIAIWRPSNRTWYIRSATTGSVTATPWGASTDIPVPGN
jgi:uncharacterized delta-60 repeat protein